MTAEIDLSSGKTFWHVRVCCTSDPRILEIRGKSRRTITLPLDDLSGAVPAYDQNSSDFLIHIFGETRDGKTCISPVVLDTKNVEITNPKT